MRVCLAVVALLTLVSVAVAEQTALKPAQQHPYLYFTPKQTDALKQRLATDKPLADAWAAMLARATKSLDEPNPRGDAIELLSFAFRMTGDRKFADKVRELLLRECEKPNWGERDLLRRNPPWNAGLGTARSIYAASVGFDCIYETLKPEERKLIASRIVELGVLPSLNDWVLGEKRIHALDSMGHNWWSVCVSMAGVGAMAVMNEEPRSAEWLGRISDGLTEWFEYAGSTLETKPANFDSGAFYESANYASYGVSQYLLFRLAWSNTFGDAAPPPKIAALDRVGDYFINICYPTSGRLMSANFGDGSLHVDGSRVITLLQANGIDRPRFAWYLNQVGPEVFREGMDRASPMGLLHCAPNAALAAAPKTPDLPASSIYSDMGWAMLRSSWDKDATMLAVRSGFTWNHAHADAGSFLLFHRGKNLLIDSGNCSYSLPEYDSYYRQSQAHNVVLFNGQGENPEDTYHGSQFVGSVNNLIDAGDLKYVWADATGPMARNFVRNFRHFLWLGDVILIIDDLKTYEPGQFEWLLHFDGKPERRGLDLEISQDAANVAVRPLFPTTFPDGGFGHDFPEKMKLVEKSGLKDHDPKTQVTYYALTPPDKTRQIKFITALILATDGPQPKIEPLEARNMIGVRVRQGGTVTDVHLNLLADGRLKHINSTLSVNGWETDAYLSAITFPDGADATNPDAATRYFIAQGSYLRRDGKVVLDSVSKVFATWQQQGGAIDLLLQGQPIISARIRSPQLPTRLTVNGSPSPVIYDAAAGAVLVKTQKQQGEQ